MSDGLLVQTMQRIMSVLDEIDERKADIKEIYAEAKSNGFDKTAIGVAIREIRGRAKAETPAAEERAAIVELYVSAFDNAPRTYVHVPAREAAPRQSPSEGEVGSAVRAGAPVPEIVTPGRLPAAQSEAAASESLEQGPDACVGGGDVRHIPTQSGQFVALADEGESVVAPLVDPSPAADAIISRSPFTLPAAKPIRPLCRKPEQCAGYGSKHCGSCERAAKSPSTEDDEIAIPAFLRRTDANPSSLGDQQ